MSSRKVSFIINTMNYFLIDWRNEDRNPVNTKSIVLKIHPCLQSPFFAVWTQTELKAAVISVFSSVAGTFVLEKVASCKASYGFTARKRKWFPLVIECCWRATELISYNCCAANILSFTLPSSNCHLIGAEIWVLNLQHQLLLWNTKSTRRKRSK